MPEDKENPQKFQNLDLREAYCFGWEPKAKDKCWYNLSVKSRTLGWKSTDVKALEQSLKQNVDACYFYLASFYFTDVDSDVKYFCFFDNSKSLWGLQIQDSPKAEIEAEDVKAFFSSEIVKKAMVRARSLVMRAAEEFNSCLLPHLEDGELLEVDEVKLEAILHTIRQEFSMVNLGTGQYMLA